MLWMEEEAFLSQGSPTLSEKDKVSCSKYHSKYHFVQSTTVYTQSTTHITTVYTQSTTVYIHSTVYYYLINDIQYLF